MFAFENHDTAFSTRRWMRIIRTRTALFARKLGAVLSMLDTDGHLELAARRH